MFSMLPVIEKNGEKVMSSVDLAKLCVGETKDSHRHFMNKAEKVLGSAFANFCERETYGKNNTRNILMLPERESCLMAMSYSYELQAHVFDEWQKLKNSKPSWLVSLSPEAQIAIADLDRQRLEAIATKAHINDKRTATLMNKASQDAKKIKKLESQLQDVGDYQSIIAAGLPQRIETETNENAQTWRVLKKISGEMGCNVKKVKDERYGEVNTYHVDVINEFISRFL